MTKATQFMAQAPAAGLAQSSGVPRSFIMPLINHGIDSPEQDFAIEARNGDGAALMRLGTPTGKGFRRLPNGSRLAPCNEAHGSVGGQSTVMPLIDLAFLAYTRGYPRAARPSTLAKLEGALAAVGEFAGFLHVKTHSEPDVRSPQTTTKPPEVVERLRI